MAGKIDSFSYGENVPFYAKLFHCSCHCNMAFMENLYKQQKRRDMTEASALACLLQAIVLAFKGVGLKTYMLC